MSKINQLQQIIDSSDNIVFFGGAGVSTESGIPDFRSESGIFKSLEKYGDTPENLVSHSYYLDHTEEFFNYYKDNLVLINKSETPYDDLATLVINDAIGETLSQIKVK